MIEVLLVVGLILIGFLFYVARQPAEQIICRERLINASPQILFPYINNSRKANEWMPWQESDPGATMSYSGPDEGVGSKASWDSPGRMGTGEALVIESTPNQSVKTQLIYTRPMRMSQLAEISLTPDSGGTLVHWSVTGRSNFIGRAMCVFMNMDKLVGGQFDNGLDNLKNIAETANGDNGMLSDKDG